VAPYAVRAKPGAPVAVPIEWYELNKSMSPQKYNIKNIFRRLSQKKDPWKDFRKHRTAISEASEKADEMLEEVKSSQE